MNKVLEIIATVCAASTFLFIAGVAMYASVFGAQRVPEERRAGYANLYHCGDQLRRCEADARDDCLGEFSQCRGDYATSLAELNLIRGCSAGGR